MKTKLLAAGIAVFMTFVVYHGWAFPEKVAEFKTLKKAIAFIEGQKCPDDWCYEKKKVEK